MTRCPDTGKRCYCSPKAAKRANVNVRNRFRVYFCHGCGAFHITSRVHGK